MHPEQREICASDAEPSVSRSQTAAYMHTVKAPPSTTSAPYINLCPPPRSTLTIAFPAHGTANDLSTHLGIKSVAQEANDSINGHHDQDPHDLSLLYWMGIVSEMFIDQPKGCDRSDQGKESRDDPANIVSCASVVAIAGARKRFSELKEREEQDLGRAKREEAHL